MLIKENILKVKSISRGKQAKQKRLPYIVFIKEEKLEFVESILMQNSTKLIESDLMIRKNLNKITR